MENFPVVCGTKLQKEAKPQPGNQTNSDVQLRKKQRAARRVARKPVTSTQATASPAALKTLKKLRKKVKQCKKIQESLDRGLKVEDNQLSKLKQLKEFKQQIALLEQQVSTGKAVDSYGFQKVTKQRRK